MGKKNSFFNPFQESKGDVEREIVLKQLVDEKPPKARGVSVSIARYQVSVLPNQSILSCINRKVKSHPFEK